MNLHGKDIKIFTANANPEVAASIAKCLGLPMGKSQVKTFSDGEIAVSIEESVRGSDVFVVQSTCQPVNDHLMELLIMIDAFKRASAGRITAVMPYFGYARQDRKAKARDPISAKLVADMVAAAGADRVLTMDLHAPQIQGFFNIPVDHLLGGPIIVPYFLEKFKDCPNDVVVVSPDLGSVARVRKFAERLNAPIAIIDKRRPQANVSEVMNIIGDAKGKKVIRLRYPRRTVRPRYGPSGRQPHQGTGSAGYHSRSRRRRPRPHQDAVRRSRFCRSHRPHLRRQARFSPVCLSLSTT